MSSISQLTLSIDPGSRVMGFALFKNSVLLEAGSVSADAKLERYARTKTILENLIKRIDQTEFKVDLTANQQLICEEPVTKGFASLALNRLLGQIELAFTNEPVYIKPTSVKKAMGKGSLEKKDVRKAVLMLLDTKELARIDGGKSMDFDMFDAIAVGLTHLGRVV